MSSGLIVSAAAVICALLCLARLLWLWGYTQCEIDHERAEAERMQNRIDQCLKQRWN
jgi:hypothetical protein